MHNQGHTTAVCLWSISKPLSDRNESQKSALTNTPLELPAHVVIGHIVIESFTAHRIIKMRALTNMLDKMELPDEFEKARLFRIEILDIKTLQLTQVVRSHCATELPVPINDHK
jgi:hypothetical protein